MLLTVHTRTYMFGRILLTFTFARADTVSSYTRACCPLTNGHPLYIYIFPSLLLYICRGV